MRRFEGFQKGVNLGGWISQFDRYDTAHFDTFIREEDIRNIASLGFDHVRVVLVERFCKRQTELLAVCRDTRGMHLDIGVIFLENGERFSRGHWTDGGLGRQDDFVRLIEFLCFDKAIRVVAGTEENQRTDTEDQEYRADKD